MDHVHVSRLSRSLHRLPSRREVVRGLVGMGIGLGTLRLSDTTEAKKKRKKRKKPAQAQVPPPPPLPPPLPPPPPPVCSQLGDTCTPGQSLCCDELLCIDNPIQKDTLAFTCCKKQGASCTDTEGECCLGLGLVCTAGVCQPAPKS